VWIWFELQFLKFPALFTVVKNEGIGQHFQQSPASGQILLFLSLRFLQLAGIANQALETSLSVAPLLLRDEFSIHGN
jgi:hypothetical protein